MRRFESRGVLPAILLALASGGCVGALDKPEAPPPPAPITAFESPTGQLGQVSFARVLEALGQVSRVFETVCGWDPLQNLGCLEDQSCAGCHLTELFMDALASLLPSLQGAPVDGGVAGIAGVNGYLEIHRICRGYLQPPEPDPANGSLDLTVGFTGEGFDPFVWGTATDCRFSFAGRELSVSGDVALVATERVPFDRVESTPILAGVLGTLTEGGMETPLFVAVRTRLDGKGPTALLVDRADIGSYVFTITPVGVFVIAADGVWGCNVVTEKCSRYSAL